MKVLVRMHSCYVGLGMLTVANDNGRYAIVTIVSKRMFPFCSAASRPSATDEAEKSCTAHC